MRILALDTSTRATVVALCEISPSAAGEEGTVASIPAATEAIELRDDPPAGVRPRHTTRLLELVMDVLAGAGASPDEIERVAVGTGPGTFTGLRIGIATARALARGWERPLVGVPTLASLALPSLELPPADSPSTGSTVLAVLDARRREVFAAGWARGTSPLGTPALAPAALAPAVLAEAIAAWPDVLAVGDGALAFRAVLERAGARVPADECSAHGASAVSHCRLAAGMAAGTPDTVRPRYLRLPDAEQTRLA